MKITVDIFPVVGKTYKGPFPDVCQVSKIDLPMIEIIPAHDSTPRWISCEKFYQLFGNQEGK